jgi:hypothetical protein
MVLILWHNWSIKIAKNVAFKLLVLEKFSPVYNRREIPDLNLLFAFHQRMCYTTCFLPLYVIDESKVKVRVTKSLNRSEQVLRFPGNWGSHISWPQMW